MRQVTRRNGNDGTRSLLRRRHRAKLFLAASAATGAVEQRQSLDQALKVVTYSVKVSQGQKISALIVLRDRFGDPLLES
jgi:hypothetical protein